MGRLGGAVTFFSFSGSEFFGPLSMLRQFELGFSHQSVEQSYLAVASEKISQKQTLLKNETENEKKVSAPVAGRPGRDCRHRPAPRDLPASAGRAAFSVAFMLTAAAGATLPPPQTRNGWTADDGTAGRAGRIADAGTRVVSEGWVAHRPRVSENIGSAKPAVDCWLSGSSKTSTRAHHELVQYSGFLRRPC